MSIIELEEWIKQVRFENEKVKFSNEFTVEYDDGEDYTSFIFHYDFKKNRYECSVSVYHASEDNNAENVEAHTDEYDYHCNELLNLVNLIAQDFGEKFLKEFAAQLEKENLK